MPIDPAQLAQDKDFATASPADQISFLSAQDPDFAKAERQDQLKYIDHILSPPPASGPDLSFGEKNALTPIGQANLNVMAGIGQGAMQTVHGTGELIRKGLNFVHEGAGDAVIPPEGQNALGQMATPANTAQKVGKAAEDIGEFVAGDEALKTLSLGKRALEAAGLAEKYEKASPFVKGAIEHVMNAVRTGTTAGTEATAKTGDVKEGAKAAAAGAALSGATGVVTDLAGTGLKYIRAAGALKELPGAVDKAVADTVSQKAVADGLKATTGTTAAQHLEDSALQYKSRAQSVYKALDDEAPGFQELRDKTQQLRKAYKVQLNLDPAKANEIEAQIKLAEHNMDELLTDEQKLRWSKADQDYNKFRAQSDMATKLQKASGASGAANPAALHVWSKSLGTPKVVGAMSRMEQALGPDGAEAIQKIAAEGRSKSEELARQAKVGRAIKIGAGVGAAGAVGAGAASGIIHAATH